MRLVRNRLEADAGRHATGQAHRSSTRPSPVGLVFRSVGYKGVPLPGVPFNDKWAVILNDKGRVLDPDTSSP